MQKIALEEHFLAPSCAGSLTSVADLFDPTVLRAIEEQLPRLDASRLDRMDAAGIDIAVLSQTAPGVQQVADSALATEVAFEANGFLARQIAVHPSRYRGFACLALQDPPAAALELERCVKEHGFVGALINGHTNGHYLDEEAFEPFWQMLEQLEVPLYLHPGTLFDQPHMFKGCPGVEGAFWSWTCETATHALRLVQNGVFDRFPSAQVILGHMGETLPYELWRFDSRSAIYPSHRRPSRPPSEVIRSNFLVTTAGVCSDPSLLCALAQMGEDRVMFATDHPYEDIQLAGNWIDAAPLSDEVKAKVCWQTAARLFGLDV